MAHVDGFLRLKAARGLKQLALLWLLCAAAGFVVVAGMSVLLAMAFDGGRPAPTIADGPARTPRAGPHGALQSLATIPNWVAGRGVR
jgi:hypothetical protein